MLTDQQRAELKALADAATQGPWEVADTDSEGEYGSGDDMRSGFKTFGVCAGNLCIVDALNSDAAEVHEEFDGESLYAWDEIAKRNAAFIAAAREAIPALLADLEEAEAELAATRQLAEATTWQPIETAPLDGTTVIIGREMGIFGFVRGFGHFEGVPGSFVSGWISQGFNEFQGNLGLAQPSHWMPLPAAPNFRARGEKGGA